MMRGKKFASLERCPKHARAGLVNLGVVFGVLLAQGTMAQPIVIDDFSTDQTLIFAVGAGTTASSFVTTAGTDILGGERDLEVVVTAGAVTSGEVKTGEFFFSVSAGTTGDGLLMWDGTDGLPDSADLDPVGLGGVDLTAGATQNALLLQIDAADQPGSITLTVYTDGGNFSSFTQAIPITVAATDYVLPYSAFVVGAGAGADFSNVGAVTLSITGTTIDAEIAFLQTTTMIETRKADTLLLDLDFDGMAGPGDTVRYTVMIENPDDAADQAAVGVTYASSVDANTALVVGSVTTSQGTVTTGNTVGDTTVAVDIGNIADSATITIMYDVTLANPIPSGVTQIACQGTATIGGVTNVPTDDPDDPTSDSDPTLTPVVSPAISTTKADVLLTDVDMDGLVDPGDTVQYTVIIQNTGTAPATGVMFSTPAVANATLVVGSVTTTQGTVTTGNTGGDTTVAVDVGLIAASGSVTITFSVMVVDPLPAGVTEITCQGTVTGTNFTTTPTDDPDNGGPTDPTDTPISAAPDLAVTKDDGGASTTPGGTVSYTLSYVNNGNQDATGVVLTDTVPANATFNAGASTAGWVCLPDASAGSVCTLAIGSVAASAGGMATFAVDVDDPLAAGVTELSNTASVADDGMNGADPTPGDNSDSDTTPVNAAPDLAVTKDDSGATTTPGGTVSYTLSYVNNGNQDATGVVLTDTVPAHATFNAGASTAGWVCLPDASAGSVCTLAIGSVAASAGGMATFAVDVDNPLAAGVTELSNTVSVADDGMNGADPTPGDNSDSDTTPVTATPDLAVTKDDSGVGTTPGGTVSYTLSYVNNGDQDATGVVLTDTVPANTTFNAGASTAGWACVPDASAGSVCTLAIGNVAASAGGMVIFAVDVDNPLPGGVTEIDNTVSVADDGMNGADPTPGDNSDSDTTPVTSAPDLTITKDDGGVMTTPGGTVSYTLSYANTGDQNATGVVLTDTVPANTTFNAGASTAGWVCAPDANAGSVCTLAVGSLASTASGMATFAVDVDDPLPGGVTEIDNTASIADDGMNGADPTPGNNSDSDTTPIPTITPPAVDATKAVFLAVDANNDGLVSAGDTLEYVVSIVNNGPTDVTMATYTDTPDPNTTLINGSVMTSQGMVTSGNGMGETTIGVDIGTIAVSDTVTVIYQVTINDPLPPGVMVLINQGTVSGTNITDVPTDDPVTSTTDDPTMVPIGEPITPPPDIPTMSTWGLLALILLLGWVGLCRLREGRAG